MSSFIVNRTWSDGENATLGTMYAQDARRSVTLQVRALWVPTGTPGDWSPSRFVVNLLVPP